MSKFNEELQLKILARIESESGKHGFTFEEKADDEITSHPDFVFNMEYLKGSGLIEYNRLDGYGDNKILILYVKITAPGIDFLNNSRKTSHSVANPFFKLIDWCKNNIYSVIMLLLTVIAICVAILQIS